MGSSVSSSVVDGVLSVTSSSEVNSAVGVEVFEVTVSKVLELREHKVGSSIASGVVNGVSTIASSDEVNSAVAIEVSDVTIGKVLELREVQS